MAFLLDFNAQVGRKRDRWYFSLCKFGVGKENILVTTNIAFTTEDWQVQLKVLGYIGVLLLMLLESRMRI